MIATVRIGARLVGLLSRSGSTVPNSPGGALAHNERHQGLLSVQAVLGLVPHCRAGALEHLGGDLLAAVRWEAVEHDGPLGGERDDLPVDAVAGKIRQAALALVLLAHARPDVRVEDVCAGGSRAGISGELDGGACA